MPVAGRNLDLSGWTLIPLTLIPSSQRLAKPLVAWRSVRECGALPEIEVFLMPLIMLGTIGYL